jgi:hypothetical protein
VGEADGAVVKVAWCLEGVGYGGGAPLLLVSLKEQRLRWDGMGWDGMGWDGMRLDGMGWDGMR